VSDLVDAGPEGLDIGIDVPEANTLGLKLTEADEPSGEGPWWSP
jgi:hypothetical protein